MIITDPLQIDGAEISWFAPLCDGDDDFLGNRNPDYKSSWENTSKIVKTADALGYRNVLCPSSYQVGQDTLAFVAGMAPLTEQINLLAAIRCGEVHPPMLARSIATLDHTKPRPGLPALSLATDTSFLTAFANDFGFEGVFARQVEA